MVFFVILFKFLLGNMILIKDRHPCKWNSNDDFLGIGKYDTYKGSTLGQSCPFFMVQLLTGNMILIKDRHRSGYFCCFRTNDYEGNMILIKDRHRSGYFCCFRTNDYEGNMILIKDRHRTHLDSHYVYNLGNMILIKDRHNHHHTAISFTHHKGNMILIKDRHSYTQS